MTVKGCKLLLREQTRQLFNNTPSSTFSQMSVAALFYVLFNNEVNSPLLILWCCSVFLITIVRLILVHVHRNEQPENPQYWLNLFTFITLLVGLVWASFSVFYITIDNIELKYLFFVTICVMLAAAVPILGAWTPAFYAYAVPQIIAIPIVLLYENSTINSFLAVSFIIYCILLIGLQKRTNNTIKLTFELQQNSEQLVSELKQEKEQRELLIEQRTQELNQLLIEKTAIVENKLIGMIILCERKIQWANATFEQILGYGEGELIGCFTRQIYVDEKSYQEVGALYENISHGDVKYELECKKKDGSHISASIMGSVLNEEKGQSLWTLVDVTERKQAEERLRLSYRVFNDAHDGIIITDAKQNIIDVNPAFCEITGYARDEVIGQSPNLLSSGKESEQMYIQMWHSIEKLGHWQGEIWNRKKNGEIYAELLTISELKDEDGKVSNYVGIFSDITESKQQEETLSLLAHYDVLTKLPNRTLLMDRFKQAIAHCKRNETFLAVCFLDIDYFKTINDNFGNDAGDQLLIEIAYRITRCIRDEDTAARLGGDEFVLLLGNISSYEQCGQTMERIHQALAQPYVIKGNTLEITASSGIALYPLDQGDFDALLRHADQAMCLAKQLGRNSYQIFNLDEEKKATNNKYRLAEISQALKNDELCLYYQPKVDMLTGNVFGAEALIRWNKPGQGLIPPLDFLPILEGSSLEIVVGEWVFNEALRQLESWQKQGINLEISINVSSNHLLSDTFKPHLENILAKYPDINSKSVQLEILESSALNDVHAISKVINSCRDELGLSFALDDFGTGYSSLTHLRNLLAEMIKIDQSFVRDMLDDPNDLNIIDGVISLADSFARDVIAEGVETTAHGMMLIIMGCEKAQGYEISRPVPADEFPNWLQNYIPNQEWISCKTDHLSAKEKKLQLLRIVGTQWYEYFETNIKSPPEVIQDWPIMEREISHYGYWFKSAKKMQIFDPKWLNELRQEQVKTYSIAQGLLSKYENNYLDEARDGLKILKIAFDDMNDVLELCDTE